jgi:hypothetical protein
LNDKGFPGAGELYLQIQWRPAGVKIDQQGPINKFEEFLAIQKTKEQEKLDQLKNVKKIRGQLAFNVLEAVEIPSADIGGKSDPYCQVNLNKGDKKVIKTKTIDNSRDPVWNHKDQFEIDVLEADFNDFSAFVKIFDYDFDSNDLLGSVTIDLTEVFKTPGAWINKYFELIRGAGKKAQGKVYVQAQWRPEGKFNKN